MLKIITVPNKILITPSKPVTLPAGRQVKKLAKEMTMLLKTGDSGKPLGVGLSACQVNQPVRLFIAYSPKSHRHLTLINPKILWQSKKKILGVPESKNPYEGCLSIPDVWGKVWRRQSIKISYQNLKGTPIIKKFSGFLSAVIQHEYDHLNGILFVQRVLEQKGKLYKIEKNEEGKESLIEIEI